MVGITDSMDMNLSKLLETVEGSGVLQSMGSPLGTWIPTKFKKNDYLAFF